MNLSTPTLRKIFENYGHNNELLIFLLGVYAAKSKVSPIKYLFEEMSIDIDTAKRALIDLEILSNNDLKTIEKIQSAQVNITISENEYETSIQNIINHLKGLKKSRLDITANRKALIKKWLNKGYSEEDFMAVNSYFFHLWKNDPKFSRYIKPETLYNEKFPNRVETAREFYSSYNEYKAEIKSIIHSYEEVYKECMHIEPSIDRASIPLQSAIVLLLNNGYSKEDIVFVVESSVRSWSKKPEIAPYISLEKILDNKFPDRLRAAKAFKQKKNIALYDIFGGGSSRDK